MIYINVGDIVLHSDERSQCTVQWCSSAKMAIPFACSFNIFYIYQAFILRFHKALHPPSLFLSFCPPSLHLSLSLSLSLSISLSLSVVPHPVFLISGLSLPCGLEMLVLSSCNPKFFAVRHIHYPVTVSTLMQ